MGKSGKKGRLPGAQRKAINAQTVSAAMNDDGENVLFGRVLKHLGTGHVRVILPNKREGIAKIRTVLSRRGSTPIATDDVVVLSGRDFETRTTEVATTASGAEKVERYDLLGVLTRAQAAKMEKDGRIPSWFTVIGDKGADELESDIFDYTETPEEDDDEVDVDNI